MAWWLHLSALNGPMLVLAFALLNAKALPPGPFMNTVFADGCERVR